MTDNSRDMTTPPASIAHEFARWMEGTRHDLLRHTKHLLVRALSANYDAEDILQDSLCSAWEKRDELGILNAHQFELWMKRVIQNRMIDLMRQSTVHRREVQCGPSEPWSAVPGANAGLEAMVSSQSIAHDVGISQSETAYTIVANLGALPFEERLCVVLRDMLELEWSDVASTLGRSVNGAKGLRKRARGRLS